MSRPVSRALVTALASVIVVSLIAPSALGAQEIPEPDLDDLTGYTVGGNPYEPGEVWVDPATLAGLSPADLEPAPAFDPLTLHDSLVFAAGVDLVEVEGQDLQPWIDRHVRVLQVSATLDRDVAAVARSIEQSRPRVGQFLGAINFEHRNEARLADEIETLNLAIAEFAVRAFIADEELETAFSDFTTQHGETRIVTDEVRADQIHQIADREDELARRQRRRAGLEQDLRGLRSELRTMRRERLDLLELRRTMDPLAERTADTYRRDLHIRLPEFVEGTDIPLVALNAYEIAARATAETSPQCGIEWWMLAGVGKVESFHGHFAPSTLDINGQTTSDIRGPALDGRILSGAEFLEEGAGAPAPTGRTEDFVVTPTPAPAAPAPAGGAGSPPDSLASADGEQGQEGEGVEAAPVISRLALILDTDDGLLDSDRIFDRAVGPMQFIPGTWRLFGTDGNLDEETDPQNIYDATRSAARLLCASTSSMRTVEGRQQAFFAYNHDEAYSALVEATGLAYSRAINVPDPEVDGEATTPALGIADEARNDAAAVANEAIRSIEVTDLPDW